MLDDVIRYVRLVKNTRMLRKNAWLKRSELERIQQKKLRAIVKHAYHNVPFYHKLFDSVGVKPEDIKTIDDLSKIPIVTKSQIQRAESDFIARDIDTSKCTERKTSGSTGLPLKVVRCGEESSIGGATYSRLYKENGLRREDVVYALTSPTNVPDIKDRGLFYSIVYNLAEKSLGKPTYKYVSVFENMKNQLSILKKTNPTVISGYSMSIKLLAMAVKDSGINTLPRLIFTASELLDAESIKIISSAFGVNPTDFYATIENDVVAWECSEHAGYHTNIDTLAIEFIKDNEIVAAGEKGEVILTNLYAYAMPLIRYKIGDVGIPSDEECPCGRGLPLMDLIEGRADDFVKVPSGRIFSPIAVDYLILSSGKIAHFRIIQEKEDRFTIELVKGKDFSEDVIYQIEARFKQVLGDDIQIEFKIVDEITREESGKLRSVVSKVKAFD